MAVTQTRTAPPLDQFMAYRRFGGTLAFSHDGAHVYFVSNLSGEFNLWRVPVGGGWPVQLTAFTDKTVRLLAVSPTDGTIAFCADRDGDEFHQLYLLDPERGWPQQLTDEPNVQHFVTSEAWSPDGRTLAYTANARTPTDMEIWLHDVESGKARPVFGEGRYTSAGAWSPDGTKLLAHDFRHNSDSSIYLVEVESGDARELTTHEGDAVFFPGPWAADGSGFYLATDAGSEFVGLAFYDLATSSHEWVDGEPTADIEGLGGSEDHRYLARLVNESGWARLRIRDVQTGDDLPEPDVPPGGRPHLTGFQAPPALSHDGSCAAVILSGPRRPPEVWVVETASGSARAVTESRIGGLREDDLADVELVSYSTFDGRDIPAWLYRANGSGRAPVVLAIHGGPQSQERPIYNPLYQYLVSRGISVLATNIRGSSGYGKSYMRLIERDWGAGDMQDWDHAVKWLKTQDWVDDERIGVWGGSYGGFAVLTCVTRLPDHWACAVDIFGPSNLVTFARAVPPTWRRMMKRFVGDPDEDEELLRERSPMTYIENVQTPLLVMQGATDPRVVKGESDQLVDKLRSLGRTVEYRVFEDEGHGFTKRENELESVRLSAAWLEKYLTPDGAGD